VVKVDEKTKLDDKDLKILKELQADCSQSIGELSKKLKIPEQTLRRRKRRLEKERVIRKYTAVIDPKKVGKGFVAFFLIAGRRDPKFEIDDIGKKLSSLPGIQEAFCVAGERDFLMKGHFSDIDEYYKCAKKVAQGFTREGGGMIATKIFKENVELELG